MALFDAIFEIAMLHCIFADIKLRALFTKGNMTALIMAILYSHNLKQGGIYDTH